MSSLPPAPRPADSILIYIQWGYKYYRSLHEIATRTIMRLDRAMKRENVGNKDVICRGDERGVSDDDSRRQRVA